ncbi:S1C family serine protease [Paenibacillus senegalensis]|uniref:S1C family serine protease n=1 Tax=Paenibacillus senegalensis TaxID=1465766 RepID=UPI00028A0A70|nr:trypsin-like peptidase domain-containing protein [Paenibacillus senegalensis]
MDEKYNNSYDDYFRKSRNGQNKDGHHSSESDLDTKTDRESPHYYSYGPYRSQDRERLGESRGQLPPAPDPEPEIEMTEPRPVKPIGLTAGEERRRSAAWAVNEQPRKQSRWKTGFLSFLAGAVVVGGLMFASDRANLFTPDQAPLTNNESMHASAPEMSDSDRRAQSAAWDLNRPNNIAEIVQSSGPAVVKIETYTTTSSSRRGSPLMDDPLFRYFFGDESSREGRRQAGMGTGFIFDKSGYILTNEHVVHGSDEILVTVQGYDEPFEAELLGNSYDLDLAVLKIKSDEELPYLRMAESDNISVGDWVVAIGNPYGFDHTVTVGVVSAKEREIPISDNQGTREYKHLLQTDASINPGNSGGPLLNLNGEVIGINTAVSSQAQGIGFAIPISTVDNVLDNLINNVEIPKEPTPFIGIQMSAIDPSYVEALGLENTDGALIRDVVVGSPAFHAGLRQYDVIVSFNGEAVANGSEISEKVLQTKVGDTVTLGVVREGKKIDVEVTIGDANELEQNLQR